MVLGAFALLAICQARSAASSWVLATGGNVISSPVLSRDEATVFVGSDDRGLKGPHYTGSSYDRVSAGGLYAVDAATGQQRWNFTNAGDAMRSSPALSRDDRTVFAGSWDALYAVDATTGQRRWRFSYGRALPPPPGWNFYNFFPSEYELAASSPVVSHDIQFRRSVFVGSLDGYLYAVDATTGQQRWRFNTHDHVFSSPALNRDDTTVFVGSGNGYLYAVDAVTGQQRWKFSTAAGRAIVGVESSPALSRDDKTVFVGSRDGLYAVDAATGQQRWRFDSGIWGINSSPVLNRDETTVYVGSDDWENALIAVDAATGQLRWNLTISENVRSSPALSHDELHVYVGSSDGYAYAIRSGLSPPRAAAVAQ